MEETSSNDWRVKYGPEWRPAEKRVGIVKKLLQKNLPKACSIKQGFMATSTQMVLTGIPDGHETGSPDLFILYKKTIPLFNIESTGTYKCSIGNMELWIRPDKMQWAVRHHDVKTWVFFVYPDKILYIDDETKLQHFSIRDRYPKDVIEPYHIVPQSAVIELSDLSELEKFRQKLRNEVEKARK